MPSTRTENDSMGAMEVPEDALYGASTQRAVLNFPVSGYRFGREFIRALGLVKWAAAEANLELERLDDSNASLIAKAAREVIEGRHDAHFPIDIFHRFHYRPQAKLKEIFNIVVYYDNGEEQGWLNN